MIALNKKWATSLFRFFSVGGVSYFLNLGFTTFFHEVFGITPEVSIICSSVLIFIYSFIMLRYFVYGKTAGSWKGQFTGFLISTFIFRGLEWLAFVFLLRVMGIQYQVALTLVTAVSSLCKFLFYQTSFFKPVNGRQK